MTEITEYGNKDINEVIGRIEKSCKNYGLLYSGKGKKERQACKWLLSKKFTTRIEEYGMTLEQFIDNVIKASTILKYNTQQVTSAVKIYYNREDIVNKTKQETVKRGGTFIHAVPVEGVL